MEHSVGPFYTQVDFACSIQELCKYGNLLKVDDSFCRVSSLIFLFILKIFKHSFIKDEVPGLPHFDDLRTLLVQEALVEVVGCDDIFYFCALFKHAEVFH